MRTKCRICLLKIEPNNFTNIFTTSKTGQLISEVLTSFAPVQISENDGLPDCLCSSCEEKVNILIDFRMLIVSSDSELRLQCEEKSDLENEMSVRDVFKFEVDESPLNQHEVVHDPLELRKECKEKLDLNNEELIQDALKFEVDEAPNLVRVDNEEEFACEFCKIIFSNVHDLDKHEVIHDPDRPFVCYTCSRSFKYQLLLVRHNKILHSETGYKCYHCKEPFQLYSSLRTHLKTHVKTLTPEDARRRGSRRNKRRFYNSIQYIGKMSQDWVNRK